MGRALAVIIWVLTLLSVSLFFINKWWFPTAISSHAAALDRQFLITIIVVGIAFTAAQVGLGYMVWKYREDADRSRATYTHGSSKLEVIWTVVTAIIFIGLAVMGQSVWASLRFNDAPAGSYQIEVVAQQFQWNFHYPGTDGVFGRTDPNLIDDSSLNFIGIDEADPNAKDDAVHSVLAIPSGRPVELLLRSKDVIHNIWVPQLRFKQDLVPGMVIRVHFTANTPGKYELACAELCGQLHFKMKSYLLVLPDDELGALTALPQDQFQTRMTELLAKYQLPTQSY
ncbi:MAG: cytochrome c oxidase subunit II [Acidobacteria bacterium]|nr:cytochrome c oxidase subunit II [Acidobacteriota bacterium]